MDRETEMRSEHRKRREGRKRERERERELENGRERGRSEKVRVSDWIVVRYGQDSFLIVNWNREHYIGFTGSYSQVRM